MRKLALKLLLCTAGLCLAACPDAFRGPQKPPTSALWLGSGVPAPEVSQLAQLQTAGVGELFVEMARLEPDGKLVRLEPPDLPPATSATLAIAGDRSALVLDPDELAARVAAEGQQLRFYAEGRGLLPVGLHFDLVDLRPGELERYGAFLARLRKRLDRTLFLSASVPRGWIELEELEAVTGAVDFVVAFLYGQRRDEEEDAAAWDFIRMQRGLERLEDLGVRYLAGLTTVGTATVMEKNGTVRGRTTRVSFTDLLWNRRLKLRAGFSLEGVNRQVYTLVAEQPVRLADLPVQKGELVRVMRPATSHLEEYMRLRGAWSLKNLLGQLYYRAPAPDERLSLTVGNLINGLASRPATPDLAVDANLQRGTGRGFLFRFTLTNRNDEVTELSLVDHNYLEVGTDRGRYGRVRVGDFFRFVLFRRQPDGSLEATFRRADVIRLHLPMLEGGQSLTSGDVEIISSRQPVLTIRGRFILTDGRTLDVGPITWREGRVTAAPAAP